MNYVCPLCRGTYSGVFRFWTLRKRPGFLRCTNPSCEGRFITSPFPILTPNPARALERMLDVPKDISIPALGMLLRHLDEESALYDVLCTRSTAVWSQFCDFLPEAYRPDFLHTAPFTVRALAILDAARLPTNCKALVAGSGPGREALELAARLHTNATKASPKADKAETTQRDLHIPEVIALDDDPALLQFYRQLVTTSRVQVLLRAAVDRWHSPESIQLPRALRPATELVQAVCGDIMDPPFEAESFDLVVSLNLLDRVPDPLRLLGQLQALTKPGGFLLLSSPFAWDAHVTPREKRLAAAVPHARMADNILLQEILTGNIPVGFDFELQAHAIMEPIEWARRIHDTQTIVYRSYVTLWKRPKAKAA